MSKLVPSFAFALVVGTASVALAQVGGPPAQQPAGPYGQPGQHGMPGGQVAPGAPGPGVQTGPMQMQRQDQMRMQDQTQMQRQEQMRTQMQDQMQTQDQMRMQDQGQMMGAQQPADAPQTRLEFEQGRPEDLQQRQGPAQREVELVQTTLLNRLGGMGFAEMRDLQKRGEMYYAEVRTVEGVWVNIVMDPRTGEISVQQ